VNEAPGPLRLEPAAQQAAHVDIITAPISQRCHGEVPRCLEQPATDCGRVLAFRSVHSAMTAQQNPQIFRALLDAGIATADGMPLVGVLRSGGNPHQPRVDGDPSEIALAHRGRLGWHHFLMGAPDETLERHTASTHALALALAPGDEGREHVRPPPFRRLRSTDEEGIVERIRNCQANLAWAGLGIPERELWMTRIRERLPGAILLVVGAVFNLLSCAAPTAPHSIQDQELACANRLWKKLRRLWRSFLNSRPAPVVATTEAVRHRHRAQPDTEQGRLQPSREVVRGPVKLSTCDPFASFRFGT
jgi:N-acetylglucosaminyldiphosphoundecaprenol N-acetyl-beta-D-mannosaminyltransferase